MKLTATHITAALFLVSIGILSATDHVLENRSLKRAWSTEGEALKTTTLVNNSANLTGRLESADEFLLSVCENPRKHSMISPKCVVLKVRDVSWNFLDSNTARFQIAYEKT